MLECINLYSSKICIRILTPKIKQIQNQIRDLLLSSTFQKRVFNKYPVVNHNKRIKWAIDCIDDIKSIKIMANSIKPRLLLDLYIINSRRRIVITYPYILYDLIIFNYIKNEIGTYRALKHAYNLLKTIFIMSV
jgi:hypothetical protein